MNSYFFGFCGSGSRISEKCWQVKPFCLNKTDLPEGGAPICNGMHQVPTFWPYSWALSQKNSIFFCMSRKDPFLSSKIFIIFFHPKTANLPEFEKSIINLDKRCQFYLNDPYFYDFVTKRPIFLGLCHQKTPNFGFLLLLLFFLLFFFVFVFVFLFFLFFDSSPKDP